jgi:hypothetical protein
MLQIISLILECIHYVNKKDIGGKIRLIFSCNFLNACDESSKNYVLIRGRCGFVVALRA